MSTLKGLGVWNVVPDLIDSTAAMDSVGPPRANNDYITPIIGVPCQTESESLGEVGEGCSKPREVLRELDQYSSNERTASGEFEAVLEAGRRRANMPSKGRNTEYSIGAGPSPARLREIRRESDYARRCGLGGSDADGEAQQGKIGSSSSSDKPEAGGEGPDDSGAEDHAVSRWAKYEAIANRKSPFDATGRVRREVRERQRSRVRTSGAVGSKTIGGEIGRGYRGPTETTRKIVSNTQKLKASLERLAKVLEEEAKHTAS